VVGEAAGAGGGVAALIEGPRLVLLGLPVVAGRNRCAQSVLLALLAVACTAIPVRVERDDPRAVHRDITGNVLTRGEPSDRSLQVLERYGLRERFEEQPVETLALLHGALARRGDQRRLSALAELSFHYAEQSGDRRYYLASAAYAYALLFPGPFAETLDPSDPRVRLAFDLYNRGITQAMRPGKGPEVVFEAGTFPLPFGTVEVELPPHELEWAGHRLTDFVAAADFSVSGLRNRYRRTGVGAALSAELLPDESALRSERFLPELRVPATLFVRFEEPRETLDTGRLRASIEIYTPDESSTVPVDGLLVPVEFETSSSLAASFAESPLWDFELRGFFSGTFRPLRRVVQTAVAGQKAITAESEDEGLLFLQPYRHGRIPVVLVHGTASSPARWANLVNELSNERAIRDRYQVWLFLYNTGNPIGYSAGLLRRALERAVTRFDPEGRDAALRQMVVIGHSQGGLLTKLTAVDSDNHFWGTLSNAPLDELELSDGVRETLRMSTFFTPEPFVGRVIFVCTPHRGSYLASFSLARMVSDFVAVPSNLTQVVAELVLRNQNRLLLRSLARLPTSVDNMTPGNFFIRTLSELRIAPGIHAHSIIAVKGDGPMQDGSDGVVSYESAHLDGVDSELVVHSGHSAQDQPATIEEIRRILLEHAAGFEDDLIWE
jgi:pimeloyl-ACP methyl ester carboxylesterase